MLLSRDCGGRATGACQACQQRLLSGTCGVSWSKVNRRGDPGDGRAMSSWKHVLSGIAAFGLVVLLLPGTSSAAGLVAQGVDRGLRKPRRARLLSRSLARRHRLLLLSAKLLVVLPPLHDGRRGLCAMHAILPLPAAGLSRRRGWRPDEVSWPATPIRFLCQRVRGVSSQRELRLSRSCRSACPVERDRSGIRDVKTGELPGRRYAAEPVASLPR